MSFAGRLAYTTRMSDPLPPALAARTLQRLLAWFQQSGILRPADGFWGVAERLAVLGDAATAEKIRRHFPCATPLAPGVVALEHRRADCCFETAFLFDTAAEVLDLPACRGVADRLIEFLLARTRLQVRDPGHPCRGLWGWATPFRQEEYWVDDNAWCTLLLLKLSGRGRPELRPHGIQAARTLFRHMRTGQRAWYGGDAAPMPEAAAVPLHGLRFNPHWSGLACMAFAHASAADPETPYAEVFEPYFEQVLKGPLRSDPNRARHLPPAGVSGRNWTLSEYAYLGLCAAVVARRFPRSSAAGAAEAAGTVLLREQQPDGHFPAEHAEAPAAPHLADLIYTDNWAVLALQHLWHWSGRPEYREAARRSLAFLAAIQDQSATPLFRGCWRGLFDTRSGAWGGGDLYEGGAGSIYSGWTNAPIGWAFLAETAPRAATLFAPPEPQG